MTIGTSNLTTLSYIKEVTPGSTPASPAMKLIRFTGESLNSSNSTTSSEEIRDDRATADLVLTDQSNGGEIMMEVSGQTLDDFIESALFSDSTWNNYSVTGTTISSTVTGFTNTAGWTGLRVGQTLKFTGFANAPTNALYYYVSSIAGNNIVTIPTPPVVAAAGPSVTGKSSAVKTGKTDSAYTIQKAHKGVSPIVYENFRGVRIASMNQEMNVGGLAKISFGLLGMTSEVTETQISGLTEVAKNTNAIMNCVGNVTHITAIGAGIALPLKFTTLNLSFDNSLRELKAIGQLGSVDVRAGTINASATINPYFESKELLLAFKNNGSFLLTWGIAATDGYAYVFSLPNVKFSAQTLAAGSKDADMIVNATMTAIYDGASACVMQVSKFIP